MPQTLRPILPLERLKPATRRSPGELETVALAVHLDDMHMVVEAVQQAPGDGSRAEDLDPFVERQVGGHHDGALLVALAEDLEEQIRPGAGQRHEAQFVDDQQIQTGELPLEIEQASFVPSLHEFVNQASGGAEAHGHVPLAGGQAPAEGHAGLAGAAVADGDDILAVLDVLTASQFHHQGLVHRGDRREVEAGLYAFWGAMSDVD